MRMENGCAKSNAVTVVSFEIECYWNIVFMFSNFGHIDWCEWNESLFVHLCVRVVFFFISHRNEMTQAKTSANRMANLRKNECKEREKQKKNYRRWG